MNLPVRKNPRLQGFDYKSNATYFVTTCLNERSPLFGHVTERAHLIQTDVGNMIAVTWIGIPDVFPTIDIHDFVVMPDHIHGLMTFTPEENDVNQASLGDVMRWFKGKTRHLYSQGVKHRGWTRYSGTFWQGRFHDHIIRNERDFDARVTYIERNPWRWVENRKPTRG